MPGPVLAVVTDASTAETETAEEDSRQQDLYEQGTDALDEGQWDRAVAVFGEAARQPGERADGALYWKAYAQSKLGRRTEALATLAELVAPVPEEPLGATTPRPWSSSSREAATCRPSRSRTRS